MFKEMKRLIRLILSLNIVYMYQIITLYPLSMYNYYVSIKKKEKCSANWNKNRMRYVHNIIYVN
jgi:hypothetical protein